MNKNIFCSLMSLLAGLWIMFLLVNYTDIIYVKSTAKLQVKVNALEKIATIRDKYIEQVKKDLKTCQGDSVSREASLEDFYEELIYADRIDVTAFSGNNQPRRLIFDCGDVKE